MSNWLDLPNTSNRFIQTYVKGFMDISGGKLIIRNDDASFNNRLFVGGDTSLNSLLYVANDITTNKRLFTMGDASLNGNLFINYDVSMNSRLVVGSDITTNKRLFTLGDASLNGNLFVNYDVSMNSRLTVGSDITTNKRLFTLGDASLNGNLFVNYDVSMNSKLTVGSDITTNKRLLTLGDASLNGNLFVNYDVSINSNLAVGGDVNIGNRLFANGHVLFNNGLIVKGDCKFENIEFKMDENTLIPSDNIRGGVTNAFGKFTYDFVGKTLYDIDSDRFLITRMVADVERYNFIYANTDLSIKGNIASTNDISLVGNLYVGNNISISGRSSATSFETESDYRIKANVKSLLDTSFTVDLLKPVTYINKKLNRQDIGFIAHEVKEQIPFLVRGDKDDNELQSINYNGIIGLLTKEIQELKIQNKMILKRLNDAGI
jgi:hypothetical protein